MRALVVMLCLLLASGSAMAQVQPAEGTNEGTSGAGTSGLSHALLIGAGVVGGIVVADLLMGGSVTGQLLGISSRAASGPMYSAAEFNQARAGGALVGERILAATERRDMMSRAEFGWLALLGVGGVAGWFGVSALVNQ